MPTATTCIYKNKLITVDEALEVKGKGLTKKGGFSCAECGEDVNPHASKNNTSSHFEHYSRNKDCSLSDSKNFKIGNQSIKELYADYKLNPRNDWIKNYRDRCEQVSKYKNKEQHEYDIEFLKDVWLTPANGVADASPGFMSKVEFDNLLDELPEITSKIAQNPTRESKRGR